MVHKIGYGNLPRIGEGRRINVTILVLGDNHDLDNPLDTKFAYAIGLSIMRIIYLLSYKGNADEHGSI